MPLAAIADNGDFLGFDQIDVGVTIIINAHGKIPRCLIADTQPVNRLENKLKFLAAPGDGDHAGA